MSHHANITLEINEINLLQSFWVSGYSMEPIAEQQPYSESTKGLQFVSWSQ